MTDTPSGFAPIFAGWNVWGVWQKNDLDFEPLMVGLSPERRLRIWVEEHADSSPGAAVGDPANPAALKGSQVEIIPSTGDLQTAVRKESVPGPTIVLDSPPTLKFVRFFNRGTPGTIAWPHDDNYLLDAVYAPASDNPITSAPAPDSLAGAADKAASTAMGVLKVVAIVGGIGLGVFLIAKLASASKTVREAA